MIWERFYQDVKDWPVIESASLHLLYANKREVELQLSRWVKQEKLIKLKRGFYILDDKYRKVEIFEPYFAAILKSPSYISLEKALEMHHLIPDVIYTFTSVTTRRRPIEFINRAGRFKYTCIKKEYFWGYGVVQGPGRDNTIKGYLAEPEKAIIDLFYVQQKKISPAFIESLRLQNTGLLDIEKLARYSRKMGVPFISRAVDLLLDVLEKERE